MIGVDRQKTPDCIELTSKLVEAYVSHNKVPIIALPDLIASIGSHIKRLMHELTAQTGQIQPWVSIAHLPRPTQAQVEQSITQDVLISFIDGKPYKSLKRHLAANGLNPSSYRQQFGLPDGYPMISPSYRELRCRLSSRAEGSIGKTETHHIGRDDLPRANATPKEGLDTADQTPSHLIPQAGYAP